MTFQASPFCVDSVSLAASACGVLDGLRFVVKDVFDIEGRVTGCGNPDWGRSHDAAQQNAAAVDALRACGAQMLGQTVTDELAYSLNGENWHYGTPPNPRAPGRIPGGSSSGSASAVALELADIGLGTDCGGSVRLPASFCGLYGMRPSHGRISAKGLTPLAPSFDTVAWFAASARHLRLAGAALLGPDEPSATEYTTTPRRLLLASDLFAELGASERAALQPALARLQQRFAELGELGQLDESGKVSVSEINVDNADPDQLMQAFRTLQGAEVWAAHGAWIERQQPQFGPGIAQRFALASTFSPAAIAEAQQVRDALRARLEAILTPGTVLCLPTAPGIAPPLNSPAAEMEQFRASAMRFLCLAGLAGTPQISIPVTTIDGCPFGLSLMMGVGADRALLDFVAGNDVRDDAASIGRHV